MSRDDYHVIVYKILEYLYACMKHGIPVEVENIAYNSKAIDIAEEYWKEIIINLLEEGYIKGVILIPIVGSKQKGIKFDDLKITPKGIDYLVDNSLMKKAKGYAKTVLETLGIFL